MAFVVLTIMMAIAFPALMTAKKWCKDTILGINIWHNAKIHAFIDDSTPQHRLEYWAKFGVQKWDSGTNTTEQLKLLIY